MLGLSMARGIGSKGTSRLLRVARHMVAEAGPIDAEAAPKFDAGYQSRSALL